MDIRNYLKQKGYDYTEQQRVAGLVAVMNCPFCDDKEKKFAISLQDGAFNCLHQNNCGVKGSWWDFQKRLGDIPVKLDSDRTFYPTQIKTFTKPKIKAEALKEDGYQWLVNRGFTKSTIGKFRIGQKDGALMFPIFKDGEHVNTKFRMIKEKKFWNEAGTAPYLFNRDAIIGKKNIAICEGFEDCMALDQYNIPAVSVPNGTGDDRWIELEWEYLDKFQKIYLFFDNDDAGQIAVEKIVKRLGEWRCYNVIFPYKDANECLMKNVSMEDISQCIENASEYNLDILKKAEYYRESVKEKNRSPEKKYGYTIGMNKLNEELKGWREGELTILHGHNGSGKSTFISQEILFQITKGFKVCVVSLEMLPEDYLNWMCNQYCKKEKPTDEEIDKTFDLIGENLIILNRVGDINKEIILDAFNFASRKYGAKYFILDNMMRIKFNHKYEFSEQTDFVGDCKNFALEHRCHFFLLAHPRKGSSENSKPQKSDILGSSNIGNIPDNIIALWRNTDEKSYSEAELHLQKNRQFGYYKKIKLFFNPEQRIFTEEN